MSLPANTSRFLLDDVSAAWMVERGHVDLFLVDILADGNTGPLFHATTVAAGDIFCGAGRAEWLGTPITLMAQLRPGATVVATAPNDAQRQRWNAALTKAGGLQEAFGEEDASIGGRASLELLAIRRSVAEQEEMERLQRKDEVRGNMVDRAIAQLGDTLNTGGRAVRVAADASPLLAACSAVGNELGVSMRTPRNFSAGDDPIRDAQNIARSSGVRYREVNLEDAWWKHDHGPLLAFRIADDDASKAVPVALLRRRKGYMLFDGEQHSLTPLTPAAAREIAPAAMMFYRPFPSRELSWKDLLRFGLFDTWRDGATVLGLGAVMGLLALVVPLATGILFDTIIPGAQRGQLLQMAVMLFAANMVTFLISLTSGATMQRMESRMETAIQSAVWDRLLSLPARFFKDYNSGDLVVRSLAVGQIRKMLTSGALNSILTGIFSIFSFLLLFHYSSTLALVATVLVVITATVSGVCGWLQMRYMRRIYESNAKLSGYMLEVMNGIAKLRLSGTEPHAFARWASRFAAQKATLRKSQRVTLAASVFNGVLPSVCSICIFYFGLSMMETSGRLSPGDFVAFNTAFGQFLGAAIGLASTAIAVIGVVPAYEQAAPILQALPESTGAQIDPGTLRGSIEASRLSFRYRPELPLVLQEVSFRIEPGQFVAFVGHSGSGKSTLFRLLLGFEQPESGFLHFDGMDLADIEPQALRRQMGVVLQNGRVFDGDIFTNIVGSAPLSMDDAWAAARAAGLDKDIEAMPMGMHTVISEGAGTFSGGQRQRLLIARAIVHKPRILLFDEATSALDNQTQAIVSRSLEQLNATRIVIAHRLSTILNADHIFVFDSGRIVQHGTYDELMGQEGLFRELASRQIA